MREGGEGREKGEERKKKRITYMYINYCNKNASMYMYCILFPFPLSLHSFIYLEFPKQFLSGSITGHVKLPLRRGRTLVINEITRIHVFVNRPIKNNKNPVVSEKRQVQVHVLGLYRELSHSFIIIVALLPQFS